MKEKRCNACGRLIGGKPGVPADYLEVDKEWGYFSGRDLEVHRFCLCEECYDKLISRFRIPVSVDEKREVL